MSNERLVLPVILSATFVQLVSVTIAQVAAPAMRADLGAGPGAIQLVLAGYTLTYACLLITAARLGERYGYRLLFVLGTVVFILGTLGCVCAPGVGALIAARLVQGAGSGLVAPQVLSIIQVAIPQTRRARALGLYGATMGVASLVGPLAGGLLLAADVCGLGWRSIFLVTVPLALASLLGAGALPRAHGADRQRVDGIGVALTTVGFGALILPLALGRGAGWPWWTWASFAVAAVALTCFARTVSRRPDPLIHPRVFDDRAARWGVVLVFVFNAGVPSFTYLLFLYLQTAAGYSPIAAALTSAPFAMGAVLGSRGAPALSRRYGSRLLTVASLVLAGMALVLAPLLGFAGHRWTVLPVLAIGGVAFGAFTASVFALVMADVHEAAVGSVSGLLPTAQQLGGTVGVTAAGLAYFAPASSDGAAFTHAMIYEVTVFVIASLISLRLRGRTRSPVPDTLARRRRTRSTSMRCSGSQ